jgi:hypothetical protein
LLGSAQDDSHVVGELACEAAGPPGRKGEKGRFFLFLLFLNFPKPFAIEIKFSFESNKNQSSQEKLCSSMYASTYSYPYIAF